MAGADRSWKANTLIHEGRRRNGIEAETSKKRKEKKRKEMEMELVSICKMLRWLLLWVVALRACGGGIRCKVRISPKVSRNIWQKPFFPLKPVRYP
jgi:hypothetical protein